MKIVNNQSFNIQKRNAQIYNKHLDSGFSITKESAMDSIKHINDCIENPTIGLIARKQSRTHKLPSFCYEQNYRDLMAFDSMNVAVGVFENKFDNLYPRSGKARKYLINSNSIMLDSVNHIKKTFSRQIFKFLGKICK